MTTIATKRIMKACNISPQLKSLLGVNTISRPEGLKLVWNYIK
jgi:chromatin remodeling complex protein RSC6